MSVQGKLIFGGVTFVMAVGVVALIPGGLILVPALGASSTVTPLGYGIATVGGLLATWMAGPSEAKVAFTDERDRLLKKVSELEASVLRMKGVVVDHAVLRRDLITLAGIMGSAAGADLSGKGVDPSLLRAMSFQCIDPSSPDDLRRAMDAEAARAIPASEARELASRLSPQVRDLLDSAVQAVLLADGPLSPKEHSWLQQFRVEEEPRMARTA